MLGAVPQQIPDQEVLVVDNRAPLLIVGQIAGEDFPAAFIQIGRLFLFQTNGSEMQQVTRAYMGDAAMRYDTVTARAFRRALGLPEAPRGASRGHKPRGAKNSRYDGAGRLMAQKHGVQELNMHLKY